MRSIKATIVLGTLLTTGMAFAQSADTAPAAPSAQVEQGKARHQMNPDKMAKHLAKKLGLSQDQVAQIKPILADRVQQMQSLRADSSLSPQDRRAKFQAIQQDSKSKIEAVLNDQQKQQFEQMMAERAAHHRRHGGAGQNSGQ